MMMYVSSDKEQVYNLAVIEIKTVSLKNPVRALVVPPTSSTANTTLLDSGFAMATPKHHDTVSVISVSFRGKKVDIPLPRRDDDRESSPIAVGDIRTMVAVSSSLGTTTAPATTMRSSLQMSDIKLIFKGKVLVDDQADVREVLTSGRGTAIKSTYRIIATGVSQRESQGMDEELQEGMKKSKALVRDDLTEEGQRKMVERQRLGRRLLQESDQASRRRVDASLSTYGFDKIETLPNLPDEAKAREILSTLANDPGIRSCMAKHKWRVESLAELYPEGKVGETEVCLMGLNKNKGQQILLRIRTDDLKGFRKMLSIREVLYHELAHNVHSEHDGDFFQLMRQIKQECLEMDWTKGEGTSTPVYNESFNSSSKNGGAHRLGGETQYQECTPSRDLARRAATRRLAEAQGRQEIGTKRPDRNCACGLQHHKQIDHRSGRNGEDDNCDMDTIDEP